MTVVDRLRAATHEQRVTIAREAIAEGGLDPSTQAYVYTFLINSLRLLGQPGESIREAMLAISGPVPDDRLAWLLVNLGLAYHDLGDIARLREVVGSLNAALSVGHYPDGVIGYALMLKGRMLMHDHDPAALETFRDAITCFRSASDAWAEAWAQLAAGRLNIRLACPERSPEWAVQVTYAPYLPKAQVQIAESLMVRGVLADARSTAASVESGAFGAPDDVDLARLLYIRGGLAFQEGNVAESLLLLHRAGIAASQASLRDIDLIDAINELRRRAAA